MTLLEFTYGYQWVPDTDVTTQKARQALIEKGWSYRTAAPYLGVCYQHLALVLTGRRHSQSLLNRIFALPRKNLVLPGKLKSVSK